MPKLSVAIVGEYIVVLIPKKQAAPLGALIDVCLDTVGCVEGRDVGLTDAQLRHAEDNMIELSTKLQEL